MSRNYAKNTVSTPTVQWLASEVRILAHFYVTVGNLVKLSLL
jgi:hypothetical protein